MNITRLTITNFLGLRSLDVALDTPVSVFAGPNGAGKSSIRDAIRFAFFGDCARARLKKDHGDLVTHGAKTGGVKLETSEGTFEAKVKGSMKGIETPDALPYVLDAQAFAGLDPKARRTFLSSLLGVSAKPDEIAKMVAERGCDMQLFETVKPMLRSGFDAAHSDCKDRATEAKGAWRAITGETWGSAKGEDWAPEMPLTDLEVLAERESALRVEIDQIGDQVAKARARAENAGRMERLRELADMVGETEQDIDDLSGQLGALREREEQLREASGGAGGQITDFACPDCGVVSRIRIDRGKVVVVPDDQADPVVDDKALTAVRAEIGQVERQLEAARQQLAEARNAAKQLADEDGDADEPPADLNALRESQQAKQADLDTLRTERLQIEAAERNQRDAADAHGKITAWLQLADAFAPDGIPGELLARTIKPVNSRLRQSAEATGWPLVTVDASMTIAADGRRYELLSESEKWRCDAMLAEAIAHLSGLKLLVLDRMDVLDLASRGACLKWLSAIGGTDHDTIIVMATLKAAPVDFAPNVTGHWLEGGRIVEGGRKAA